MPPFNILTEKCTQSAIIIDAINQAHTLCILGNYKWILKCLLYFGSVPNYFFSYYHRSLKSLALVGCISKPTQFYFCIYNSLFQGISISTSLHHLGYLVGLPIIVSVWCIYIFCSAFDKATPKQKTISENIIPTISWYIL